MRDTKPGGITTDTRETVLDSLFLFDGLTHKEIDAALAQVTPETAVFRRGEMLCEPQRFRRALYILLRGECDVLQGGESRVVMNTLHAGDTFGVVSLFSRRSTFPSTVSARRETEVMILSRGDVEKMMAINPRISINLLAFLTDRVEYLNQKAAALTEPTVEKKLASFLLTVFRENEGKPITLNRKHTAEALHCGRASLYRALDALEAKRLITRQDNDLFVISPEGLERI